MSHDPRVIAMPYREITSNPLRFEQWRQEYMETRRGLGWAADHEWLASFAPTVYGLFEDPEPESEPMICLLANREGTRGQFPCAMQWTEGNTWMNCLCGTRFTLDEGVQVWAISRISPRSLAWLQTVDEINHGCEGGGLSNREGVSGE